MYYHNIPYDMSHFPISPLDLEFLLAGLSGLTDDDERLDVEDNDQVAQLLAVLSSQEPRSSPTEDDLSQVDYDEDDPQTGNRDARIELEDGEMEEEWIKSVPADYAKRFDNAADSIAED